MIIKNGKIFTKDALFQEGILSIKEGVIADILTDGGMVTEVSEGQVIDANGGYVIPGLVDIHFHGCVGYDFCDGNKEAFDAICQYQLKNGVTSISPATMTLSREELTKIFETAGNYDNNMGSMIRGITMEGPFISVKKKGAQNEAFICKPDKEFFYEMQKLSGGLIKQVAVAPEEDTDYAFTKEISKEAVVSVAHTTADYDTANEAFQNGATHVTHLFNAMPAFAHRDPGVVGAAYDNELVYVELICDGIHIHSSMVRAMFDLFGPERICMISDSMMATGMVDGNYSLGGQAVTVKGKLATLKDGTIAGSASNLMDCLRVAVKEMDISLEDAVTACTITPAKSLHFDDVCGSIEVGKNADVVILNENLEIQTIIKNGEII